jgi:hypothetical protein
MAGAGARPVVRAERRTGKVSANTRRGCLRSQRRRLIASIHLFSVYFWINELSKWPIATAIERDASGRNSPALLAKRIGTPDEIANAHRA